jgi:hypothetical protein
MPVLLIIFSVAVCMAIGAGFVGGIVSGVKATRARRADDAAALAEKMADAEYEAKSRYLYEGSLEDE